MSIYLSILQCFSVLGLIRCYKCKIKIYLNNWNVGHKTQVLSNDFNYWIGWVV